MRPYFLPTVWVLALGCAPGEGSLRVDVRTDYVPGVEFDRVVVHLEGDPITPQQTAVGEETLRIPGGG